MLDTLAGFVGELRRSGLPVSPTENLDAVAAVAHVPLVDREALRWALAATLVKRQEHRPAFDTVFDVWFSLRLPVLSADEAMTAGELATLLDEALESGDEELLRELARQAVARLAGMHAGRPVGGTFYVFRTLRQLDAEGALERLLAGAGSGLHDRLERDELRSRLDRLRAEIEAEVRRRLVAEQGPEAVAGALRRPLPADVDFLHASPDDLAALRRTLHPLARRMAARLARKRRHHRRGRLDMRRTVRQSLSYGGVPVDPRFRRPHPSKPEILVLADISGSVAAFARFTLQFVHAISGQFSRVRSFVFIDGVDEVTSIFEGPSDLTDALARVNAEADVVWADGHSDYGHAFQAFWERWGREITPRTSVVILGDARNNYHAAN
ncbi:MAG TPA: VWA domain-containing protein, partial [Acidimicrobiales bacterium]